MVHKGKKVILNFNSTQMNSWCINYNQYNQNKIKNKFRNISLITEFLTLNNFFRSPVRKYLFKVNSKDTTRRSMDNVQYCFNVIIIDFEQVLPQWIKQNKTKNTKTQPTVQLFDQPTVWLDKVVSSFYFIFNSHFLILLPSWCFIYF